MSAWTKQFRTCTVTLWAIEVFAGCKECTCVNCMVAELPTPLSTLAYVTQQVIVAWRKTPVTRTVRIYEWMAINECKYFEHNCRSHLPVAFDAKSKWLSPSQDMKQRRSTRSRAEASAELMSSAELIKEPIIHYAPNQSVCSVIARLLCLTFFKHWVDLIIYYQHAPCRASSKAWKGVLVDRIRGADSLLLLLKSTVSWQ